MRGSARFALRKSRRGVARAGQHSVQQPCSPAASSRRQSRRSALLRTEVYAENGSRSAIYLCKCGQSLVVMPAAGSSLLLAVTNCEQNLHGQQLSCGACIGLNWLPEKYAAITRVEACHDSTLSLRHRLAPCVARESKQERNCTLRFTLLTPELSRRT